MAVLQPEDRVSQCDWRQGYESQVSVGRLAMAQRPERRPRGLP